jgi:hypothetical protein
VELESKGASVPRRIFLPYSPVVIAGFLSKSIGDPDPTRVTGKTGEEGRTRTTFPVVPLSPVVLNRVSVVEDKVRGLI